MEAATFWSMIGSIATIIGIIVAVLAYRAQISNSQFLAESTQAGPKEHSSDFPDLPETSAQSPVSNPRKSVRQRNQRRIPLGSFILGEWQATQEQEIRYIAFHDNNSCMMVSRRRGGADEDYTEEHLYYKVQGAFIVVREMFYLEVCETSDYEFSFRPESQGEDRSRYMNVHVPEFIHGQIWYTQWPIQHFRRI